MDEINSKQLLITCRKLKVLYVEDSEEARVATLELLKNYFNSVTVAKDGKEGLLTFEKSEFDLIITDINMPNLNGIEMIKRIRMSDAEISVIVLSAHNDTDYFLQTIRLDVESYIIKPIDFSQFTHAIFKCVEKIELRDTKKKYQKKLESQVKERTSELQKKLDFDDLTGLYSRYSFFEHVRTHDYPAVFIIDIDNFNHINELYGIDGGNTLLVSFAKFLDKFANEHHFYAYRLSGDEFIFLDMQDGISIEDYEKTIETLFSELKEHRFCISHDCHEDNKIGIDVTLGISLGDKYPYESAKMAFEHAKKSKKPYAAYSALIDKRQQDLDTLKYKDVIKDAISNERITALFQPIVNKEGEVIKYEALMRIQKKDSDELISPYYFLDIAIKTKLYDDISSIVIFKTLDLALKSQSVFSINFAYSDIENRVMLHQLEQFLSEHSNLGSQLLFEITENEQITNYDVLNRFIKRFRKYGVKIAIDDFGSGFSNFEFLLQMPLDYLKIDGSLIKNIDTDERSLSLVKAIIQFSHELGIKVIAEFVHSETIFTMLKVLNVDEYQGYYFSEPLREKKI